MFKRSKLSILFSCIFLIVSCSDEETKLDQPDDKVPTKGSEATPNIEFNKPDDTTTSTTPTTTKPPVVQKPGLAVRSQSCVKPAQKAFDTQKYYQSIKNETGKDLQSALNKLISNQTIYDYNCVWYILEEANQDPLDSSKVKDLYTGKSIDKSYKDNGSAGNEDSWNREHVWPKSHGFSGQESFAFSDAHNLFAADKSINEQRSDKDFAEGGVAHSDCTTCNFTEMTWEPSAHAKGDIARTVFYMATRYDGNDNSLVRDLQVVNTLTKAESNQFGMLCTLLKWHENDPVSAVERQHNEVVYQWQLNRNPFIDNPKWVESIWGKSVNCN